MLNYYLTYFHISFGILSYNFPVINSANRWSTDMMKSLVAGKTVTVTYFQRDRYGRILGQVYAPDGMNVNQFMVRAGAAWVYEQYNTDPVLPVLQNEARQQKRGLWSDADPVPPWIWRHRK
ncbi:hypothetical protein AWH01_21510 [Escherichia coli]|nr:thermonuclease family protein [Escherichia coli]KZK03064.1 hypothetical protein AWH01_21510 [Escherichia coli]